MNGESDNYEVIYCANDDEYKTNFIRFEQLYLTI